MTTFSDLAALWLVIVATAAAFAFVSRRVETARARRIRTGGDR